MTKICLYFWNRCVALREEITGCGKLKFVNARIQKLLRFSFVRTEKKRLHLEVVEALKVVEHGKIFIFEFFWRLVNA